LELGNRHKDVPFYIYRTVVFERCLADLRNRKGTALMAARKVEEFLQFLTQEVQSPREKYRLTSNGEHRIKNCKKIDLVGGYRLVCIQKDNHLALLYVGSHDDCFRWIERNKGMKYETDDPIHEVRVRRYEQPCDPLSQEYLDERRFLAEYEENLMKRIDDKVLTNIFFSLCKNKSDE
jgi:hypothetical protein